jgi:RNA polymerase sigma factor (sigma-70 family)
MLTERRALSLNPRPDVMLGSPEREDFLDGIRAICGSFTMRQARSTGSCEPSVSGGGFQSKDSVLLNESSRAAITRYANRISRKAGLPKIADDLETEGLGIFAEEVERLSAPPDIDPWGIIHKRVWDRMWNFARRERTKRFQGAAKHTELALDRESELNYEVHETRQSFRRGLRPEASLRTILDAIESLPEPQRSIAKGILCCDPPRTQEELAKEIGMSQGSVSRYYNLAKAQLAETILLAAE